MYVCNCNGLRQRDVALAIEAGADREAYEAAVADLIDGLVSPPSR